MNSAPDLWGAVLRVNRDLLRATMQTTPGQPGINNYRFGRIEINGLAYTSDVIILPDGIKTPWWRDEGHTLKPGDLLDVLAAQPEVLVIGQGAQGLMKVTCEARACLEGAGIEVVCATTARAVELYNERCRRGRKVAAALHLTC